MEQNSENTNETYHSHFLSAWEVLTTVGYGHAPPQSDATRVFSIFYLLVGIPFWLLLIADLSHFMSEFLLYTYNKCKTFIFDLRGLIVFPSENLPFGATVSIVGLYIIIGAGFFAAAEGCTYFEQFYETVVTLTTVGFGDVSPDVDRPVLMYFTLLYYSIGLVMMGWFIETATAFFTRFTKDELHAKDPRDEVIWIGSQAHRAEGLASKVIASAGLHVPDMEHVMNCIQQELEGDSLEEYIAVGQLVLDVTQNNNRNVGAQIDFPPRRRYRPKSVDALPCRPVFKTHTSREERRFSWMVIQEDLHSSSDTDPETQLDPL